MKLVCGPSRSGYIRTRWSNSERKAFAQLPSLKHRINYLIHMRKKVRRNLSGIYSAVFLVLLLPHLFHPHNIYDMLHFIFTIIITLLGGILFIFSVVGQRQAGLWHNRLVAVNANLEILALTEYIDKNPGLVAIANKSILYLRNFEAESTRETHHQVGSAAHGAVGAKWMDDTSSTYIHRSVIHFTNNAGLQYVEAANLARPLLNAGQRYQTENFLCLSLYDTPDWKEVVSAWISNSRMVIVNINGVSESIRFEVSKVCKYCSCAVFFVERDQWQRWARKAMRDARPCQLIIIYDEISERYQVGLFEQVRGLDHLNVDIHDNHSAGVKREIVEVENLLSVFYKEHGLAEIPQRRNEG